MMDYGMINDICELAERDGERPPAPSWHRGDYPALDGCNADGDPARDFLRDIQTGIHGYFIDLCCNDVLTAQGVQRGPTVVNVDTNRDGLTPEQARALAAALIAAADTAEGN